MFVINLKFIMHGSKYVVSSYHFKVFRTILRNFKSLLKFNVAFDTTKKKQMQREVAKPNQTDFQTPIHHLGTPEMLPISVTK